jgi:hypothetical protein
MLNAFTHQHISPFLYFLSVSIHSWWRLYCATGCLLLSSLQAASNGSRQYAHSYLMQCKNSDIASHTHTCTHTHTHTHAHTHIRVHTHTLWTVITTLPRTCAVHCCPTCREAYQQLQSTWQDGWGAAAAAGEASSRLIAHSASLRLSTILHKLGQTSDNQLQLDKTPSHMALLFSHGVITLTWRFCAHMALLFSRGVSMLTWRFFSS